MCMSYACIQVTLLVTSQLHIETTDASWVERVRRILRSPFRMSGEAASRSERANESAAADARTPSKEVRTFFTKQYKFVKAASKNIFRLSASYRRQIQFNHEIAAVGRQAIAALIESSLDKVEEEGAECIFQSGSKVIFNSAYHGGPREYERLNGRGMFTVKDDSGDVYTACVMVHPRGAKLPENAVYKAQEALTDEFQQSEADNLNLLYQTHRLLTLQDILFPLRETPFITDSKFIYLNAIFLYGPSAAYLSHLLPLNKGRVPSCPQAAKKVERARLSLSSQVISIVASYASVTPLLPSFTTASFVVTERGVVYMTSHPRRRLSNSATGSSDYSSLPCSPFFERSWTPAESKLTNSVDLATVLYNIWCPIQEGLLEYESSTSVQRSNLTDPTKCYPLLPMFIRNLIASLANAGMSCEDVPRSAMYRVILNRLRAQ